jgi:hypothetical protein
LEWTGKTLPEKGVPALKKAFWWPRPEQSGRAFAANGRLMRMVQCETQGQRRKAGAKKASGSFFEKK